MERAKPVAFSGADPGSPLRTDAQRDPWIGQAIKARYKVSRRLAAGPSGNLYIAQDAETGAAVTIKLLPIGIELDADRVRRLRDELSVTRAVARIRPNVAIVHDCDRTASDRAFLVLEPLAGQSLADVIDQGGPLPVERSLRLAFEIADGLQAAHNLALVHGALDAEDVLVGAEDTVKLMGFEVARLETAEPAGGLTEQADIQALGLLLIQMLTGAAPPQGEGSSARPERQLGPEVPAAVRELVMQALARSPDSRASDMGSVANALWVELYRVAERPDPTAPDSAPAVQPRRRVPWRTMGMGALVALVVGVIALGAWVSWYALTAPPPVPSAIQGPTRRTPPARAQRAPAPAPVGRSVEVAGRPPITPPPPRSEPIPQNVPAIKSTPRVTLEEISVTPRATPPDPALPATRTPPPSMPVSAQGTPLVRVTPGTSPAWVIPPTELARVAPPTTSARAAPPPPAPATATPPPASAPAPPMPAPPAPASVAPPPPAPATATPPPASAPAPPVPAPPSPASVAPPPPAPATVTPPPAPAERVEVTSGVPLRPVPESGASGQEPRPEREPSAIIDWLLRSPRQQR